MTDKQTANSSTDSDPISIKEKVGYGLGDTASNLYWKLFENFQLYFYTEVFGISAISAGWMFFVTKLWDAFNDPMVGYISDRTQTAWGRFRPYLVWMCVPFAVTGILTFYTPDLSPQGKLIYAYATYILVFMAYTAINIPYGALMGVISPSSLERTSVATYRFILAFCGGLIVQKFTMPLVQYFGGSTTEIVDGQEKIIPLDPQTGFFWTVVCYACLAVVLFLITFATTKERVVPQQKKNTRFWADVKDLMGNWPWMVLLIVGLFQILGGWTRGSATGYYFKYYLGVYDFGNFLVAGTIASICGMLLTKPLKQVLGAKWLMIWANVGVGLLTIAFLFLKPGQTGLMYTFHIMAGLIGGPIPVLLWSMYADVADYSEWKNNRRATGLVFAAATFSQKMGGALGGAVPGWCLASYGFREPVDGVDFEQSPETINGIIYMMSVIPGVFILFGAFVMLFYTLTEKKLELIESELKSRKETPIEDID
ncbi:MAG: MFS transporter [Mariniblastus sp.]